LESKGENSFFIPWVGAVRQQRSEPLKNLTRFKKSTKRFTLFVSHA
jgi:hypothetical protein